MAVHLKKDDVFIIDSPKIRIGVGWEECNDNFCFNIDVSAFLIDSNRKLISDEYLVFYNSEKRVNTNDLTVVPSLSSNGNIDYHSRPVDPDLSVIGTAEFRESSNDNNIDDDTIDIDLSRVNPKVHEIVVTLSIYDYDIRKHNLKYLESIYARSYKFGNEAVGMEDCRYDLIDDCSSWASIEMCRIYRNHEKWVFQALGIGHKRGLDELIEKFI